MTDEQRESNRKALINLLALLYREEGRATAVLDDIGWPPNLPAWSGANGPASAWRVVVENLERGVLEHGMVLLMTRAREDFPGNPDVRRHLHRLRAEQAAQEAEEERFQHPGPAAAHRSDDSGGRHRTVEFSGSSNHLSLLKLVRDLVDPQATQIYAGGQHSAVAVAAMPPGRLGELRERARAVDPNVETYYGDYDFQPALLTVEIQGPDRQLFRMSHVPNTALPRDIVPAVWSQYRDEQSRTPQGAPVRSVIDHRDANGEVHRLNPDIPLHQQNIRTGARLELSAESTAGVDLEMRLEMSQIAWDDIAQFAAEHPEFRLIGTDNDDVPEIFTVALDVTSFALPEALAFAEPTPDRPFLQPELIHHHKLEIRLPSEFPVRPPTVIWLTPIYHPNIRRAAVGPRIVCLGPLSEDYKPSNSLYDLCQHLVDIARYHNYGILSDNSVAFDDESLIIELIQNGTYFDRGAAFWAFSDDGQAQIKAIGGRTLEDRAGLVPPDRPPMPLQIVPLEEVDDEQ
ncbi:effector-associated domain EAD1-containing protein [Kitasatospora sp. NPDC127111]|uniref:effector-associated domain EAD1-containing protein n=1 Tax=Kitasatospora sp. NPDC127111 TaxID=3345363 RepID=UPI003642D46A